MHYNYGCGVQFVVTNPFINNAFPFRHNSTLFSGGFAYQRCFYMRKPITCITYMIGAYTSQYGQVNSYDKGISKLDGGYMVIILFVCSRRLVVAGYYCY